MSEVEVNDIIKITEGRAEFGGCYAVVYEVATWGVKADVIGPGEHGTREYPVRAPWGAFEVIGKDWSAR